MAELKAQRRKCVQDLRTAARACSVDAVSDDAGRKKVEGMMSAIRASRGAADTKQAAELAYTAYEATYAPAPAAPEVPAQEAAFDNPATIMINSFPQPGQFQCGAASAPAALAWSCSRSSVRSTRRSGRKQ